MPRAGAVFVISPVDDTHHLLFFGTFSDTPDSAMPPDEAKHGSPGLRSGSTTTTPGCGATARTAGVRTATS